MMNREALYFVSRNKEKHLEYQHLLPDEELRWSDIRLDEPQAMNLEQLTHEKISIVRRSLPGVRFFVEHTGLQIHAWGDMPGGITGLFLDRVGNQGICRMMSTYKGSERLATARVVIGYSSPFHGTRTFFGEVSGSICDKPRGSNGFGWDPIFVPEGDSRTFAELDISDKHKISMRHDASRKFRSYLSAEPPRRAATMFVSYAHEDRQDWRALRTHLSALERRGIASLWDDQSITAGSAWRDSIQRALNKADVFLLLVSSDFVASDFCMGPELQTAMARHHDGTALVIPVMLRKTHWSGLPFSALQFVPNDGTPITRTENRDEASVRAVSEIEEAILAWADKGMAP